MLDRATSRILRFVVAFVTSLKPAVVNREEEKSDWKRRNAETGAITEVVLGELRVTFLREVIYSYYCIYSISVLHN